MSVSLKMKKCIKLFCNDITSKDYSSLLEYATKYNKCKNLFYNLFYNNPYKIFLQYKFEIRDSFVKQIKERILPENQLNLFQSVPSKL